MTRLGASRRSSVLGLNARPQSAKRRPSSEPPRIFRSLRTNSDFCRSLTDFNRLQDFRGIADLARRADQRLDVLWKARAAVAGTRVDETVTDAWIGADADADLLDIRTDPLGDVGQFIHETDLGGQHGVGRVLGEFRGADVHDDQPIVIARKGIVQRAQQFSGARIVGADDDPIGLHEILDGGAFLQKFRDSPPRRTQPSIAVATAPRPPRCEPGPRCPPARSTW